VEVDAIVMISDEAESWLRSVSASGWLHAGQESRERPTGNQDLKDEDKLLAVFFVEPRKGEHKMEEE
jgi:hypothetical protein